MPPNPGTGRDAAWGRGVSRLSLGHKVHAVFSGNPMPDALAVTAMNVREKRMAARPSWARRIWRVRHCLARAPLSGACATVWRVRHWVTNKLLINAARIRINRRKAANA